MVHDDRPQFAVRPSVHSGGGGGGGGGSGAGM